MFWICNIWVLDLFVFGFGFGFEFGFVTILDFLFNTCTKTGSKWVQNRPKTQIEKRLYNHWLSTK
jgi:hypothetical protein